MAFSDINVCCAYVLLLLDCGFLGKSISLEAEEVEITRSREPGNSKNYGTSWISRASHL